MVGHTQRVVLFLLVALAHSFALAETQLSLSVDKNKLYQNEILNLTIQANTELDFGIGSIFNLGRQQVESPSFENLDQDWEIIDQQQSYNMQTINGKSQSTITWRYALNPLRSGQLQIPSATFQDAKSEPLNVEVVEGNRPLDSRNPPSVFLRASIDKPSPYLQEQVIYTLELFTLGEARGEMSDPTHPDLIIEPFGETTKTYKMRYNRRYEVYERRYLLFPQRSGSITLAAQNFTGTTVDSQTRRRARARELSNELELKVKAPPAASTADTWLPATSLFVEQSFEPNSTTIRQGDAVTRKISISALGLLGSTLPEVPQTDLPNLKVYPDQPALSTSEHQQGAQSIRVETAAIVAVREGTVEIPTYELKWWDTVNDVERIATIPATVLTIEGSALGNPPVNIDPSQQDNAASDNQAVETQALDQDLASASSGAPESILQGSQNTSNIWFYIALLVMVFWITHVSLLYRYLPRRGADHDSSEQVGYDQRISFENASARLLKACSTTPESIGPLCRVWLSELNRISPSQHTEYSERLTNSVGQIEAASFSANRSSKELNAALLELEAGIKQCIGSIDATKQRETDANNDYSLRPFYPN